MLSPALRKKNRILAICETCGDIRPGTAFRSVQIADPEDALLLPANAAVVCLGKPDASETLFSAADGRYYFTVADGWGEKNGVLYGITVGLFHDFKRPTTTATAIAALETPLPPACGTWGGAMAYAAREGTRKRLLAALRRCCA